MIAIFRRNLLLIAGCLIVTMQIGLSQTLSKDTIQQKNKRPKLAALLSATIPGAGQVYNTKYWKVPVVYAGMGAFAYFASENWKNYRHYWNAYKYRIDGNPLTIDQYDVNSPNFSGEGGYSDENLKMLQETYRRYFELNCIGMGLIYVLNIVDAAVDAHLYSFDVSDDLSLKWSPTLLTTPLQTNVTPAFNLRISF